MAVKILKNTAEEVVVEHAGKPCYDVSAYIPSARMIPQGGYEVERETTA